MVDLAIILLGGSGTCLQPLTYGVNKALLPLGSRTMLQVVLAELHRAGIQNFIFPVNDVNFYKHFLTPHSMPNQQIDKLQALAIEEFNKLMQNRINIVQTSRKYPGGLASSILDCSDFVKNVSFIVVLCDDVIFSNINPSLQVIKAFEETLVGV